jgi:DNA-binding IclR family transcriptional regulator
MSAAAAVRRQYAYINYTAVRALRAVEVLAFTTGTAPQLADLLGCSERTARRMLGTLVAERYLDRVPRARGARYVPTVRLLALAAQLARRLPLVTQGERAVADLHAATGLTAFLAAPAYGAVLIIARAGRAAPWAWELLPASDCAPGHVLLAYREPWRHSVDENHQLEQLAMDVRHRGRAVVTNGDVASIAVPVPEPGAPMTALALVGPTAMVMDTEAALVDQLVTTAQRLSGALRSQ